MKFSVFLFFLSFTCFYLNTLVFLKLNREAKNNYVISAATAIPTKMPTPTPLATQAGGQATRSPSPTPMPTLKPITPNLEPIIPTPTPDVWSPADMEPIFSRFAGQYGVDKNILERLANCESHFNPNAKNGDYLGLFQFSTNTWTNYRSKMGEDINPELRHDIEASIKTAAYVISIVGTSPWPSCLR